MTVYHGPDRALLNAVPWLVLGLTLFRKSNRNTQAWRVLIPLVIVLFLIRIFVAVIPFSYEEPVPLLCYLVLLTALGITILMLLADVLPRRRTDTFTAALAILTLVEGAGLVIAYGWQAEQELLCGAAFLAAGILALLAGISANARRCRSRYTDRRFGAYLIIWLIPIYTIALVVMAGIFLIPAADIRRYWNEVLLQALLAGAISGLVLYLICLPFLILTFKSPFYRRRVGPLLSIPFAPLEPTHGP